MMSINNIKQVFLAENSTNKNMLAIMSVLKDSNLNKDLVSLFFFIIYHLAFDGSSVILGGTTPKSSAV